MTGAVLLPSMLVALAGCSSTPTGDAGMDGSLDAASDAAARMDAPPDATMDLGIDMCVACSEAGHADAAPPDAGMRSDAGPFDAGPDAFVCLAPPFCDTDVDCGCAAPCLSGFCVGA